MGSKKTGSNSTAERSRPSRLRLENCIFWFPRPSGLRLWDRARIGDGQVALSGNTDDSRSFRRVRCADLPVFRRRIEEVRTELENFEAPPPLSFPRRAWERVFRLNQAGNSKNSQAHSGPCEPDSARFFGLEAGAQECTPAIEAFSSSKVPARVRRRTLAGEYRRGSTSVPSGNTKVI